MDTIEIKEYDMNCYPWWLMGVLYVYERQGLIDPKENQKVDSALRVAMHYGSYSDVDIEPLKEQMHKAAVIIDKSNIPKSGKIMISYKLASITFDAVWLIEDKQYLHGTKANNKGES